MRRRSPRLFLVLIATLAIGVAPAGRFTSSRGAAAEPKAKTVRLLTIGNSFSRNATRFLKDLAGAGGHTLVHTSIVVGGGSLELHSERALVHERDPADKAALYANGRSLKQELTAEPWDYVTIQQASIKSHDLATYRPHAARLAEIVHRYAPQAKLLVHETWAYRADDPRFTPKPNDAEAKTETNEPTTREEMYEGLSSAYRTIAIELDAELIPVGDAFHLADSDDKWGFRTDAQFDSAAARYPKLPKQTHSLHVGWQWKKQADGRPALKMDGHHANMAGEYLGACVFYEVLFDESPVGNRFVPAGLDHDYGLFLQQTAHRAVTELRE
jgi:hypothetical protein